MPKFNRTMKPIKTKIRKTNLAIMLFDWRNSALASPTLFEENSFKVDVMEDVISDAEFEI